MSHDTRPSNRAAPLPVLYQREAADDAARARILYDGRCFDFAERNQRFAAASSAKARQLQGIEP